LDALQGMSSVLVEELHHFNVNDVVQRAKKLAASSLDRVGLKMFTI
jgi:hypothetical protein